MPLLAAVPQEVPSLPAIEHAWHLDLVGFVQTGLPKILVALVIAFVAQRLVHFGTKRLRRRADTLAGYPRRAAQFRTVAGIVRASAYALIGAYLFFQILGALGVSLTPFVASAGVLGLGISFGAQSLFKDMLNGFFILIEDQFSVGDMVRLGGFQGIVEDLTLRCTQLRDLDGTLYIVPNSQIATVSNLSRDFSVASLGVPVSAREDPDRVIAVLRQVLADVYTDDVFQHVLLANPDVLGVDRIAGREVTYLVTLRVKANQRDHTLRELRRRVLLAFEREHIELSTTASTLLLTPPPPTAPSEVPAFAMDAAFPVDIAPTPPNPSIGT